MPTKPDVTRQDVESAMEKLLAQGIYPSVAKILNITGGSASTVNRLKREIQADQTPPLDSREAMEAFRGVWAKALQAGVDQGAKALEELEQDYSSVLEENERLEGRLVAAESRIEKYMQQREELQSQVAAAQAQATDARRNSESDARRLAETLARLSALQDRHATECAQLRAQWEEASEKLRAADIRTAALLSEKESMKSQLTMMESARSQGEEKRIQLEAQLDASCVQLADARATNTELSHKLAETTSRLSDLRERYDEEVPGLRTQLAASVASCHTTELELARLRGHLDYGDHHEEKNSANNTIAVNSKLIEGNPIPKTKSRAQTEAQRPNQHPG